MADARSPAYSPNRSAQTAGIIDDANDEFIGFPVIGSVVDDGSFIMPQNVIDAFAAMPAGCRQSADFFGFQIFDTSMVPVPWLSTATSIHYENHLPTTFLSNLSRRFTLHGFNLIKETPIMTHRKLSAIALTCAFASSTAIAEDLRLGTEGAYPPFNFMDASGEIKGFDVDIGLALCARIGADCTVVAQDWDGIIPGLLANKYDFIIASMFITEERKKQVDFSDPYYLAAMTHVVTKGSDITEFSNEALADLVIGAQSGTTQADYAEATYPDADIRLYPTQDEVNLDMASGRIDMVVGDIIPMLEWVTKTDDGACCELAGEPITDPAFVGDGVGIALRQEDDDLRERLNAALLEIRADGTYQSINEKYFDIDVYTMNFSPLARLAGVMKVWPASRLPCSWV